MVILLALGCAVEAVCDSGGVARSEAGLVLTATDHPDAWGRSDCTACHALESLHRQGCAPGVDYVEVRALVDDQGVDSCVSCHGDNGVEP